MGRLKSIEKVCIVMLLLWIGLEVWPLRGAAQTSGKHLTKGEIVALLKGAVPPERVADLVREKGIDFEMTPGNESDLRGAGATDELLNILRGLAPKPPGAPVLEVYSSPGGTQVYIDDSLVARTSAQGHVRISTLPPGEHHVRLSVEGHDDYETSISLAAGKTETVRATLTIHAATGLEIRTTPGHASVYLDNVASGITSEEGELKVPNLTAGSHRVRITHDGYRDDERQIELVAGQTVQVTATLVKAEPTASPFVLPKQWLVLVKMGSLAYTSGTLTMANGTFSFQSDNGKHSFSFALTEVEQAYETRGDLKTRHDLHIVLKSGQKYALISGSGAGHGVSGEQFVNQLIALVNQAKEHK